MMIRRILRVCAAALAALLVAEAVAAQPAPTSPAVSTVAEADEQNDPTRQLLSPAEAGIPQELLQVSPVWLGDFAAMKERRLVRVLTVMNLTDYFLDGPVARGIVAEIATAFENHVNAQIGDKTRKLYVMVIPVTRDQLLPALISGYGDIAAANLSMTEHRRQGVDFADPLMKGVSELVVTGPGAPPLRTIDDLAGKEIYARRSSAYWTSLLKLNERFRAAGRDEIELVPASEHLEDNDLLELVNAGVLPLAIVDSHKAQFWAQIFSRIRVREDLAIRTGREIGWAIRQNSPELMLAVNDFVKSHKKGTLMGNIILKKYLRSTKWVRNALEQDSLARFEETIRFFERYAQQYDFDVLLVAAQGYQESRLDQSVRSPVGAVGVMQLMPETAGDKAVGIPNIEELEPNIHAGVKYLAYLRDTFFKDDAVDDLNRALFSFAGYNAGPNRIQRLRRKARDVGYDPNLWFDNVELVVAKEVGREPVQYVANIYKYYFAYQMFAAQKAQRQRARSEIE